MSIYTNFLQCKNQIQKIYNSKAKEEREIIYAVETQIESLQESTIFQNEEEMSDQKEITQKSQSITRRSAATNIFKNSLTNSLQLVLINKSKNNYYLEIVKIINSNADLMFKYSTTLQTISKIQYNHKTQKIEDNLNENKNDTSKLIKNDNLIENNTENLNNEINECYIKASRDYDIKFYNENNLNEFTWCLVHLIELLKLDTNISIKGVNYKDLEDSARKNNYKQFNTIFEQIKTKAKYQIEVTDNELNILHSTLRELNINNIISLDLEHLNSKIDQFSIDKKECFLKQLQGDFKDSVNKFIQQLSNIDKKIDLLTMTSDQDSANVNSLNSGIQKIEDKNHRIELRNANKIKIKDYMTDLLQQLTITPSRKETLLTTQYIANSELVIVSEVLDNFVSFYKNRKKQNAKLYIVEEGENLIRGIISDLIKNFCANINDFIKNNKFVESNLLKNIPSFKNENIKQTIQNVINKYSPKRIPLKNYLLDRKFVICKLNELFNNQEDLNEIDAFSICLKSLCKGIRDTFAVEFNNIVEIWQIFFESDLLDENKYSFYLDSDSFLTYDAFRNLYTDPIYEGNKFFSTLILNSFFTCDIYLDLIMNFFNENPKFNLEKDSKFYNECLNIISVKVYDSMFKNIQSSCDKSIYLGFIFYAIFSTIQAKLTSNIIGDFVQLSLKDIFEIIKNEDIDLQISQYDHMLDDEDVYDLEEIGVYKISSQETKNFISTSLSYLQAEIKQFLDSQKLIIEKFTCEIRRIGIIPIVTKAINFLKFLLAITNGIKNDACYDIFEEFSVLIKTQIEKIANTNQKYTNIVLCENYHFILKFFQSFSKCGINVDNPKFVQFENEFQILYDKYKSAYITQIFDYQFHSFCNYFSLFKSQYKINSSQIKMQNNFTVSNFDKKMNLFLNDDLSKEIDTMAKRVLKHFCKEEGLGPFIWNEQIKYLISVINEISQIYQECYNKTIDVSEYINVIKNYDFNELYKSKE